MSSVHGKLSRVRKPRVHISYEVQTDGATIKKDIPFLMGVVGDFSGTPLKRTKDGDLVPNELADLEDRKFTNIDRDNFNTVFKSMTPGLMMEVDNLLAGDGTKLKVNLLFESLNDMSPAKVAEQIEPLRKLLEIRSQLAELKVKSNVSSALEKILGQVSKDMDNVKTLASELGIDVSGKDGSE